MQLKTVAPGEEASRSNVAAAVSLPCIKTGWIINTADLQSYKPFVWF